MDRLRRRPDATPARRRTRTKEPAPGSRQLGPYRLFGKIGSGPTGRVYLAIDDRTRSKVAVKLFRGRNKENVDPLLRELRLPSAVKHPNLLPVLDAGWYRDRLYVATAHVEAATAQEFQLTYEQSARVLIKVAEAVQAAHDKGILHRAIKPTNIFITDSGEPLLADFAPASRPPLSFDFAAPEQAAGSAKALGRATDVYALGATLYYLVTQHLPFPGESPQAIAKKIVEGDLVPPHAWDKAVPPPLEAIILKAMSREPEKRYLAASQLAADLRNWLERLPVAALAERSRRRLGLSAGALAAALLVAAGAWAMLRPPVRPPAPVAVVPEEKPPEQKPADQTPHPPPEQRPPDRPPDVPVPPPEKPPEKPAIADTAVAQLRELLALHRHYLETYFLPEERARIEDLVKTGRADADDAAFLRGRVLGEIAPAVRADLEAIAGIDELRADPDNAGLRRKHGFARAPSGQWRREIAATPEGISYEGRTYTRHALRELLLSRGFVLLNGQWCRKRAWTSAPPVHGRDRRGITLTHADTFAVYDSRLEKIADPFSKIEVQVKRFTPRSHYFGAIDGEVSVVVEAPHDLFECQVRAAGAVAGEGSLEVWLRVDATGERRKLYELSKGASEEFHDVSSFLRGRRRFTVIASLKSRDDGRERTAARFLPSDAADGAPLEVRGQAAEPDANLTALLGGEAPGPAPDEVRRLLAASAERLVGEETKLADACDKVRTEAVMLKVEAPVDTPLEYEGIARSIGDPLAWDPSKADSKLAAWWSEQPLAKRRAFAAWFGLWCARERTRR